jgi:transposase
MDHIGIDLHKNQSQLCILTEDGELIEKRIATTRNRFAAELGNRAKARILVEASTESEWVARCLEELGHEVIVADPNFAPMYASRTRKVKTDRRDARALAEACSNGTYRPAHRTSDRQRHIRALLAVREVLVRTRSRYVGLIRALLRREGLRVRSGNVDSFARRLRELELPAHLEQEIAPLLVMLRELNREIDAAEKSIVEATKNDRVVDLLCTAPGVGIVTATSFVATLDRVERFQRAHEVQAYVGLVPREMSSGEKQLKGRITKSGNKRICYLLVEAAWGVLRTKGLDAKPLKEWTQRIAARRGKKIAVVALARRLAGILYAMWRDRTEYRAELVGRPARQVEVAA